MCQQCLFFFRWLVTGLAYCSTFDSADRNRTRKPHKTPRNGWDMIFSRRSVFQIIVLRDVTIWQTSYRDDGSIMFPRNIDAYTSTSETKLRHYTSLPSLLLLIILFGQRLPITKFGVQHCILNPFIHTDVVSLHLFLLPENRNKTDALWQRGRYVFFGLLCCQSYNVSSILGGHASCHIRSTLLNQF
jgi:hypothetical protein